MQLEEEGVEPQADQVEPPYLPLIIDSETTCGEEVEVTLGGQHELMTTPDQEETPERSTSGNERQEDPEIGSLYTHSMDEPKSAIPTTSGQEAVYVDPEMLAMLPTFMGTDAVDPIKFLREFDKFCGIQKKPEESSEEDIKLRIIPVALKGDADAWFRGLEPNSINTWSEFKEEFFYKFIPAERIRALRREISQLAQRPNENLGRYWGRFQSLLEDCPMHHLKEVEIYSKFYYGMDAVSKDMVNSSSGGSFEKLRLSKAKVVLGRLLDAKRGYEEVALAPSQRNVDSPTGEVRDDPLKIRVDELEEKLQSMCKKSQHATTSIEPYFQVDPGRSSQYYCQVDQVRNQDTGGDGNSSLIWNPEGPAEGYPLEHPPGGEWRAYHSTQSLLHHAEPNQASTPTPTWPTDFPEYQPCSNFQGQKFNPPTLGPNLPSQYTFISSHPYQTHSLEARNQFPAWSEKEWQTSCTNHHQNQTCPDQLPNQFHQRLSFEFTSEGSYYADATTGEVERVTESQAHMQSSARLEAETAMDMPCSYKEQQSQMDVIIRQVALLTEMLKEVQESGAVSKLDGQSEGDNSSIRPENESPADTEERLEPPLEETGDAGADSDEEEGFGEEEVTPHGKEPSATLTYINEEEKQESRKEVGEYKAMAEERKDSEARPSPEPNKAEGGYGEEGGSRSKAARSIYWMQLQPWPEPLRIGEPPYSGLRPKENKKVQGTYRHHRKKRVSNRRSSLSDAK